jgi:hypothetical protein
MHNSFHLELWLPFAAGMAIHVLKRAGMTVRSPSNAVRSRGEFLKIFWDVLVVRATLCAALFWMVLEQPALLARIAHIFGTAQVFELRLNPGTALIFGYFADSILDWVASHISIFQRELPAAPQPKDAAAATPGKE